MRPLLAVPLVALAAAALAPSVTATPPVRIAAVDLVGGSERALASRADARFTLAGVHWRGTGRVTFRTRSTEGRWSGWHEAAPEDEDGPDPGSPESSRRSGWRIGNPWWVGPSDRIEVRTSGQVTRVRAYLVWSPELDVPMRAPVATEVPTVVPRSSWGANESIRRGQPSYAPETRFAIVHHTAGRNAYTRAEAAAIVRGVQLYHVQANGWSDIGYNFLVDRFGTIYEGRAGGIDRNVVGAHALGFNTGSVGVALLGTYGSSAPSQAAQDAIARLLAWRLDVAHADPTAPLTVVSGGSERHARGMPVPLRTVSGHRDTGATECPGDLLYARIDAIAATARRTGLPKIFEPRVAANDAGARFTARLSGRLAWTVVVQDGAATEVGRGSGVGSTVDWTWEPGAVVPGSYSWTIGAGPARPATGTIQLAGGATLAVSEAVAEPAAISPNGDGQADAAIVAYRLSLPANVTVQVVDATGIALATVLDRVWQRAGPQSLTVDGSALPDGRYQVVVSARRADGAEATAFVPLTVSRMLGTVTVTPGVLSPNGDGRFDRIAVSFALAVPAEVRVRVFRDGRGVAVLLATSLPAGEQRVEWDGMRVSGPIRDGTYSVVVEATDSVASISHAVPFVSDTRAPRVRIVTGRPLRIEVDEPAVLTVRVDGTVIRREVRRARTIRVLTPSPPRRVRLTATDAAGNAAGPLLWVAPRKAPRGAK